MRTESFTEESWNTIQEEGLALITKHYHEVAKYKDIELLPDHKTYNALQEAGALKVYTVRDEESKELIGYGVFFIRHNMHYMNSLQAVQDILYVDKSRRGFGEKFVRYCDDQLKALGCQVVYHHVKTFLNFGPMLERNGYELIDLIYGRRLDQENK